MPTVMDTFRALAPPEGLRFTPLFNEPVKDENARIKRLEEAVQTIRNDLDTVVPTMVRMVAIEKDIKGLVAQLQTLTDQSQGQAMPAPAAAAPETLPPPLPGGQPIPGGDVAKGTEPAPAATAKAGPDASSSLVTPEAAPKGELPPKGAASPSSTAPVDIKPQAKPAPAAAAPAPEKAVAPPVKTETKAEEAATQKNPALGDVSNIRIADHPDKTRMVLDMTAKSAGAVKLENNGKTLVIDLSQLNWLGNKSWEAESAQLISGYHMAEGNLYVDLMYASQIKTQSILPPAGDNKNYRLVIDLFSPEVHK